MLQSVHTHYTNELSCVQEEEELKNQSFIIKNFKISGNQCYNFIDQLNQQDLSQSLNNHHDKLNCDFKQEYFYGQDPQIRVVLLFNLKKEEMLKGVRIYRDQREQQMFESQLKYIDQEGVSYVLEINQIQQFLNKYHTENIDQIEQQQFVEQRINAKKNEESVQMVREFKKTKTLNDIKQNSPSQYEKAQQHMDKFPALEVIFREIISNTNNNNENENANMNSQQKENRVVYKQVVKNNEQFYDCLQKVADIFYKQYEQNQG